jgi:hypothetical protein
LPEVDVVAESRDWAGLGWDEVCSYAVYRLPKMFAHLVRIATPDHRHDRADGGN